MHSIVVLLLPALGLTACFGVVAQELPETSEKPIVTQLRQKADGGDVEARYDLGRFYEYGRHGLEPDLAKASRWYRKAATGGHVISQRRLGQMSLSGEGFPQNFEQARQWFFLAANNGDIESQYELGVLYLSGRGVPRTVDKSIEWLERASESGHDDAQVALALIFTEGIHVEQDLERALPLLRRAGRQGNIEARYWLGRLNEYGMGMPANIDRAKVEYKAAADAGHVASQLWLGRWYTDEDHRDISKALAYYTMAARAGDPAGDVGIARLHIDQLIPHPDARLAKSHLRKAVDLGNPDAHYLTGLLIGDGVLPGSTDRALSHFRFAAGKGHVDAQFDLGSIYYNGIDGRHPDYGRASEWWARAAKSGDVRAQFAYGTLLLYGRGVDQNQGVGYALVNISAAQGYHDAITLREQLIAGLDGSLLEEAQVLSLELIRLYRTLGSCSSDPVYPPHFPCFWFTTVACGRAIARQPVSRQYGRANCD